MAALAARHSGEAIIRLTRHCALSLAIALGAAQAGASSVTVDASDIWWDSNESGWGLNVVQQYDVLFMTFFVYGPDNKPVWYVAPNTGYVRNSVFTGPLYRTTGPWIGTIFTPNTVGVTQVGSATFTYRFIGSATLNYTVDGVQVTKALTRQNWRGNPLSGTYDGAIKQVQSGCTTASNAGTFIIPARIQVTESNFGFPFHIRVTANGDYCDYEGARYQDGRMASSIGTFKCNLSGLSGTYHFFAIEASSYAIWGRFTAQSDACTTISGSFGAVHNPNYF